MTVVSKSSAFPKSVQPGIPALGPKPAGWLRGPLSAHLFEQQRPIRMRDDAEYRLVTVKRSRGGVVTREHLKGREISVKSQFLLHPGDFLISKRQIVHGACGIVPAELEGSIASNEYAILRGKPTIDLEFLNYLAHSVYFQQTCFHSSIGVHVEKMIFKLDRWLSWDFDLPPLPEQRKIAEILSTWDAAIAAQERLIANARAQKKALMQSLLPTGAHPPKKRLPGFSGEWREHELGEIVTFKGGCGFKESYQGKTTGEWPFIKVSDMNLPGNEQEIFHSQNWVDRPDAKAMRASPMPARAIVFAKVGAALMLNRRRRLSRPTIIDNNMMAAIPDENSITSDFLFLHMKTVDLGKFAQASAVPSVNQQHLAELPIILPPLPEQRKIAELLSTWDTTIAAQERLIANARAQKKALMQDLLTGKRRVKLEEAA